VIRRRRQTCRAAHRVRDLRQRTRRQASAARPGPRSRRRGSVRASCISAPISSRTSSPGTPPPQERIDGALGVGDGVVCPAECVHGGGRAGTAAFRRGHWIGGCAHKCLLSQGLTASVTPPSLLVWFARRAREDPGLLPCRITARLSGPGAPGLTTRVACHESARRWRRRGRGDALPERERVRLGAGREERDLQRPLAHHVVLAHELVHAAVAEHAIPVFVDVDAV
jgi:hypothetical protein